MSGTIGGAVVIRHGERADYAGLPHWTRTSNRPWDPPLTENGKHQAHLAGVGVKAHLKQHGLANVTHIYCSPLVRCLETAEGLISGLGLNGSGVKIRVDPRLAETVCEAWYRSWGIRGISDSTWGGPTGFGLGVPVSVTDMRPEVYADVNSLYLTNDELFKKCNLVEKHYPRAVLDRTLHFGNHETEQLMGKRIGTFVEEAYQQHGGKSTVLFVSHGGPTGVCFEHLMNLGEGNAPLSGYTATFVYRPLRVASNGGGDDAVSEGAVQDWECLVTADLTHLGEVTSAELGFATTGRIEA